MTEYEITEEDVKRATRIVYVKETQQLARQDGRWLLAWLLTRYLRTLVRG